MLGNVEWGTELTKERAEALKKANMALKSGEVNALLGETMKNKSIPMPIWVWDEYTAIAKAIGSGSRVGLVRRVLMEALPELRVKVAEIYEDCPSEVAIIDKALEFTDGRTYKGL